MRSIKGWLGVGLLGLVLSSGCGPAGSIDEGVPQNPGFTPLPQPGTATAKGKPVTRPTAEDFKKAKDLPPPVTTPEKTNP